MTIERLSANNPLYSLGVSHKGLVMTAGVVADHLDGDVSAQTQEILTKIDAILQHFGTSKAKLLTANVWLSDIDTRVQLNEVWTKWVDPNARPTRATVEARLADPNMRVEIAVTAAL